jgi:hypothetical protein
MKRLFSILVLVSSATAYGWQAGWTTMPAVELQEHSTAKPSAVPLAPPEKAAQPAENRARTIINQAIEALGGQAYLTIRDREIRGRVYSFHLGRPNGSGGLFWSFSEFPDKERIELTQERDVAELFVGNKGYEITYKGVKAQEKKDLEDYLRRRHYSLDAVLRTWINEPGVILLFEGNAIAAQHPALQVTVINSQNESVTLYFDADTHLPVKRSFEWRDPVDRQKNLEEEVYENYRPVSGIMAPYNITRFFNGDMSNQRFLNSVTINQGLDQTMFDPNSGYKPILDEKSKNKR